MRGVGSLVGGVGGTHPVICGGCCEFPGFFRITPSNTLKVLGPVVRVRAPTPGWGQLASAAWIRPWGVSFGGGHGGSLVAESRPGVPVPRSCQQPSSPPAH